MKEALLYEKLEDKLVRCFLCAHQCRIQEHKFGVCGVRQNIDGVLYACVYGKPIAMHVDPIEKKPLYHFFPGSSAFSIATIGCNFHCGFCQNWEISQEKFSQSQGGDAPRPIGGPGAPPAAGTVPGEEVAPEEIVKAAIKNNCKSISYTYTEPTIFFEYALDTAKLAQKEGLYNNFVTNGFMTKECLQMIKPYLDAANVDLKFFSDESYKKICGARLQPVLDSIKYMHALGIWVEVTTLVVTGENDSDEELTDIAEFLSGVDKDIPWHISRFHPDYKFTEHEATAMETLKKAEEIGRKAGLNYIYVGNVSGFGNDTYCPVCKKLLIKREIFSVLEYNIKKGKCAFCQAKIAGIFE
jgi:pyruvate formate lyase activating enzyme